MKCCHCFLSSEKICGIISAETFYVPGSSVQIFLTFAQSSFSYCVIIFTLYHYLSVWPNFLTLSILIWSGELLDSKVFMLSFTHSWPLFKPLVPLRGTQLFHTINIINLCENQQSFTYTFASLCTELDVNTLLNHQPHIFPL